jgi:hypothetical protein
MHDPGAPPAGIFDATRIVQRSRSFAAGATPAGAPSAPASEIDADGGPGEGLDHVERRSEAAPAASSSPAAIARAMSACSLATSGMSAACL